MKQHGVENLSVDEWKASSELNRAILYVFPQDVADEVFKSFPAEKKPSMVRVNEPLSFTPDAKEGHYQLHNGTSFLDYYMVDQKTMKPEIVRTVARNKDYLVKAANLFKSADHIFPRSSKR